MIALPAGIRIGHATYTVAAIRKGPYGRTRNGPMVIEVNEKQSDDSARDTLLHEVLHAVLYMSGAAHNEAITHAAEERLVRHLSPWLLMVLRDNPDLLAALVLDGDAPDESEAA